MTAKKTKKASNKKNDNKKKAETLKIDTKDNRFVDKIVNISPHEFENKVVVLYKPVIVFTDEVVKDTNNIVGLSAKEIGWLGCVRRKENVFLVDEVYVPKQAVHASETEMDAAEGVGEYAVELASRGRDSDSIRLWGHTHPWGSTSPSGQDDDQIKVFLKHVEDFFIRIIANQAGKMEITLYDIKMGLVVKDCMWTILNGEDEQLRKKKWYEVLQEKVREQVFQVHHGYGARGTNLHTKGTKFSNKNIKHSSIGQGVTSKKNLSSTKKIYVFDDATNELVEVDKHGNQVPL